MSLSTFLPLALAALLGVAFVVIARAAMNTSFDLVLPREDDIALLRAELTDKSSSHAKLKFKTIYKFTIMIKSKEIFSPRNDF